jgi:2-oxoglutarate ferredoxin oxidoreductase subunit gamma
VTTPNILVAMNLPSFDKFIDTVEPGAVVIVDKTMADVCPMRDDIEFYAVPATQLAEENGLKGLANVILVGKLIKATGCTSIATLETAIEKSVPAKRQEMIAFNKRALAIGHDWVDANDCR